MMLASAPSQIESLAQSITTLASAIHALPSDDASRSALTQHRLELARIVAALPNQKRLGAECLLAQDTILKLCELNLLDEAASPEALSFIEALSTQHWMGVLAGMLVAPAWDWQNGPSLESVPTWLWPTFTRYLFHFPQSFTEVGQAEKYAAHHLRRLVELERWVTVNRGSSAVKVALDTYVKQSNCIPLYFSEGALKQHYEVRARLLSTALRVPKQMTLPPFPREGRRLRIGFIKLHWGPQTETYSTMPTFEHMDKDRFEVVLFSHNSSGTDVENYLRKQVSDFTVLPAGLEEQVQALLAANLDVAVFATNVTAVTNEILCLALHRIAPLQVMHHPSCTTTGLPEMDLYVSGEMTESEAAPTHFVERLGLLPGPSHAFNYEVDRQEPTQTPTRESLGVAEDEVLFVSGANYYKIIPEMMESWARLMVDVPKAKLLVHPFNPNWSSSYPIDRFCAEFDRVLKSHGVAGDRLLISTAKYPSRSDVKALLGLGDLYLDTFPFSGVNSLVDPLECGVPTVVWEGDTFRARMASALLRCLEIPELIATDAQSYHDLVVSLAHDKAARGALKERIVPAMERAPYFLDGLAASDAFGALMETAYDQLISVGHEQFRKDRTPLRAGTADVEGMLAESESLLSIGMADQAWEKIKSVLARTPADPKARRLAGKALIALGRPDRAAQYLLEAIQRIDGDTSLWCELSEAFLQSGQLKPALEAVQACLRVDGENIDAIILLGQIAERVGQLDQIGEAITVAEAKAPEDPRVIDLAFKVRQAGGL